MACHHRMCNFRSSLVICASVPVRSIRMLWLMSKAVQSSAASPTPRSKKRGRMTRGWRSGPRPPLPEARASSSSTRISSGARGSAGGGGPSPEWMSLPRTPAAGQSAAGMRPSRGCLPARPRPARYGASAHRHSPTTSVWSAWSRGRGGTRAHPGHVHSGSGSSSGYLHTPGSRVCSRRVLFMYPLHPGHFFQAGSRPGGDSSSTSSPGPLPTSGYRRQSE